jgi:hypothetical protein
MFKKILIGVIFITFNFRISGVSILPDFIGYILIFSGLSGVTHLSPKFEKAKSLAFLLIFLSIPSVYEVSVEFDRVSSFSEIGAWYVILLILSLITSILFLMLAYNLYIGLHEIATSKQMHYLADKSRLAWKFIIIQTIASVIMVIFLLIIVAAVIASPASALGLLGLILIITIGLLVLSIVAFVFQVQALLEASRRLETNLFNPYQE